jgi:hypothetical protein
VHAFKDGVGDALQDEVCVFDVDLRRVRIDVRGVGWGDTHATFLVECT